MLWLWWDSSVMELHGRKKPWPSDYYTNPEFWRTDDTQLRLPYMYTTSSWQFDHCFERIAYGEWRCHVQIRHVIDNGDPVSWIEHI